MIHAVCSIFSIHFLTFSFLSTSGIRRVPKQFLDYMRKKRSQFFLNMATSLAACVATTCGCRPLPPPAPSPPTFHQAVRLQVSCRRPWPTARRLRLQVPLSRSIRNHFHVKNITPNNSSFSLQHCNVALCDRRRCGCRQLRCRRRAPLHPPKEIEPTSGSPRPFFRAVMRPPATATLPLMHLKPRVPLRKLWARGLVAPLLPEGRALIL